MTLLDEAVVLNDGSLMPKVGVTVGSDSAETAIKAGYRLIDCNLDQKTKLKKVNSQLYVEVQVPENVTTRDDFKKIRKDIIDQHADLCLLRLSDDKERNNQIWQELEQLKVQGWIKNIGVTNINADALTELLRNTQVKPCVAQISYEDQSLINLARENRIQVEIPVHGDINALAEIASHYGTSSVELVMRYFSQKGIIPLFEIDDVVENPRINFTINGEDLATIGQLFAQQTICISVYIP